MRVGFTTLLVLISFKLIFDFWNSGKTYFGFKAYSNLEKNYFLLFWSLENYQLWIL